jgi:hypothetical protein
MDLEPMKRGPKPSGSEAPPQNLEASATAEALRAICDLDRSDIESVEPPRGFGRD